MVSVLLVVIPALSVRPCCWGGCGNTAGGSAVGVVRVQNWDLFSPSQSWIKPIAS